MHTEIKPEVSVPHIIAIIRDLPEEKKAIKAKLVQLVRYYGWVLTYRLEKVDSNSPDFYVGAWTITANWVDKNGDNPVFYEQIHGTLETGNPRMELNKLRGTEHLVCSHTVTKDDLDFAEVYLARWHAENQQRNPG